MEQYLLLIVKAKKYVRALLTTVFPSVKSQDKLKNFLVKIGIFADRGLDNYMHILSIPNILLRPSALNSLL